MRSRWNTHGKTAGGPPFVPGRSNLPTPAGSGRRRPGSVDSVADGLTEDLALNLVLGPPSSPGLMDAYNAARKILEKATCQPTVFDEDCASDLVTRLADEIFTHDRRATR